MADDFVAQLADFLATKPAPAKPQPPKPDPLDGISKRLESIPEAIRAIPTPEAVDLSQVVEGINGVSRAVGSIPAADNSAAVAALEGIAKRLEGLSKAIAGHKAQDIGGALAESQRELSAAIRSMKKEYPTYELSITRDVMGAIETATMRPVSDLHGD